MPEKPDTELADRMMALRAVNLIGEINRESMTDISNRLLRLQARSSEPIRLVINSTGGVIDAAMTLHDIIFYAMSAPVHALVIGRCNSAATFILLSCKVRTSLPHARFVIHSGTFGASIKINDVSFAKMPRLLAEMAKSSEEVVSFYAEKLGKTSDEVKALMQRGDETYNNEMTTKEALELGLITDIVHEKVGIFPSPQNKPNS